MPNPIQQLSIRRRTFDIERGNLNAGAQETCGFRLGMEPGERVGFEFETHASLIDRLQYTHNKLVFEDMNWSQTRVRFAMTESENLSDACFRMVVALDSY